MTNNPASTDPIKTQAQGCGMAYPTPWRREAIEGEPIDVCNILDAKGVVLIDFIDTDQAERIVRAVNQSALLERAMEAVKNWRNCWVNAEDSMKRLDAILRERDGR